MRAVIPILVGICCAFALCWPETMWPLFLSGVALVDA